ncbi:hypothetical protein [Ureibacillus acetophenoni]|uniref:Uncharacterized protein n=1 Tax=Ureibacillus acetophenoni TaxID=614649 RepID=A0A285U3M8_9BACL|nr:hypothetical protein [Ureibacillus acetophenoni]SOC36297.1 hypothetical protein SAMN05877842_102211 [Ureibacillus acetophenoni]
MRNIKNIVIASLFTIILAGCSDITDALSGIDNQAQKAASGITPEALTIRSINIEYKNENFTVDELFTSILRDIFWEYDKNNDSHILTVKGTWKEGLFEDYELQNYPINDFNSDGKVTVTLEIDNDEILTERTKVTMSLGDQVIIEEIGEKAQKALYKAYLIR